MNSRLLLPASLQHPWVNADGKVAHPDSPAGGGGPGLFQFLGPLGSMIDRYGHDLLPHPQSPAAHTVALTAVELNSPPGVTKKLTCSGVIVAGGPLNDATIDLVNEAVKNESNKRYIAYETLVKVGGSIAWRANNPGNLRDASTKIGSAPGGVGHFAVFATMADGRAAQKSLYLNTYGDWKVKDAINKLTPPSENDTTAYLEKLKAAGIDLDKDVKSQIDALMTAVEANEGLIEGKEVTRVK